jgi:phage-related protein
VDKIFNIRYSLFGITMNKIYFYKTRSNRDVVIDFIETLDEISKSRVRNGINLLKEFGIKLIHSKWIKKIYHYPTVFELRITGNKQIRLLFIFYYQEGFILLHGFIKKSQKTPPREIETALKRAREFI